MKKALSLIITLAMISALFVGAPLTAGAAEYSDMPDGDHWSYAALNAAVSNGLMKGDNDGLIRPTDFINRAEAATIINRAFGAVTKSAVVLSDVPAGAWFHDDALIAYHMKTFNGTSETTFDPAGNITREQAFTVLARAMKLANGTASDLAAFSDASNISAWALGPVSAMVRDGYVNGSGGKLNLRDYITREEFAQIMHNAVSEYITVAGTYTSVAAEGNVLIRAAGVTLKDVTVAGDLIIGDGVGEGDVTLQNITVKGRLVVRGGGVNSIKIIGGGTYTSIVIAKVDGEIRVFADGVQVETVTVEDGKDDSNIILEGVFDSVEIAAENVTVFANSANVKTTIEDASITGAGSKLIVGAQTKVNAVQLTAGGTAVEVAGEVGTVAVTGDSATVTAATGGTVDSVETSGAGTTVEGSGTVGEVTAQSGASGVSVSTGGTEIKNNSTDDVTVGDSVVPAGDTATTNTTGTDITETPPTGGDITPANNYGAISAATTYNFQTYATVNGVGVGRFTMNTADYSMEAVMKSNITFSGDVTADVRIKDISSLSIEGERAYSAVRSAASISGMSANYANAISNYSLNSILLTVGLNSVVYTVSKTVYDDGVVKLLYTPTSVLSAQQVWEALFLKLSSGSGSALPNGLTVAGPFSGGVLNLTPADSFVLGSTKLSPAAPMTINVTGTSVLDASLNSLLAFGRSLSSADFVSAIAALDLICTNNTSLLITIN